MTVAKNYSTHKPQSAKEPSWFLVVMLSGIISGVLLFTIGWYLSLPDSQKHAVASKIMSAGDIFPGIAGLNRPKVLLVMGVDMPPLGSKDDYKFVRTDTMMLVKLEPGSQKVNIVSIPRDSKVFIAGDQGINKINAAFTLGGPQTSVDTVKNTFGVNIDNYVVINLHGVRQIIDALGGIDIYVEKPMHYRDNTAKLNIDLQPGLQHLDGVQAEGFLRYRHDALGDIGRIRRQQQFIAAVTSRLKDPSILLKVKPLLEASSQFLITDMSTQDLVGLVLYGKDLNRSNFQVATLPGHPSMHSAVSYWIIDPQPAEEVLNRMIIGVRDSSEATEEIKGPSVGILYTPGHTNEIKGYEESLQTQGFNVVCKLQLRRSGTRLITHNDRQPRQNEAKLLQSNPALKDAQLIFSPHGATFETNSCGNTDYTIILGDDTRSADNQ